MMEYSKYNQIAKIPDEDAFALVNFRTGAIMRLEPFQKALFDRATDLSEETRFAQKLLEAGFLVNYDELGHMKEKAVSELGRNKTLGLTICPTLACNFACPYCYETARSGRMSKETEEQIVQFAKESMELFGLNKLDVTWLGGEPLLCPDIIESLSEKFLKLCEEFEADYHAGVITNGWFLTEENIRLLERADVTFIQITLDGPTPETNDHSRREKGGGSSFNRIMENIQKLGPYNTRPKQNEKPTSKPDENLPKIAIRCNINRENAPLFETLRGKIDAIAARRGLNISTYSSKMNIVKPSPSEISQKEMSLSEYAVSQKPEDLVRRWATSFERRDFCLTHHSHSYCIDELGNLYKCWEEIGNDDFAFGHVKDFLHFGAKGNSDILETYSKMLFPTDDKECMECKFLPLCMGGCVHRRLLNRKECMEWKGNAEGYVLTRYRMWKKKVAK